jgi:urea transporter-like protein/peptidase M23-like protein
MTLMSVDTVGPKRRASLPILPPLQGGIVEVRAAVEKFVGQLGPSLGNVFLIPHPWIGMVLWVAVASTPRLAAFGLLGLGVAWAGQHALGIRGKAIAAGLKANALLSAIAAGWMTAPTIYPLHIQIGIAVAAAASAFVITAALMRALKDSEWPSLLWGYCLTAGTLFAMFPVGTMMASQRLTWWRTPPADAVEWIGIFFRSIGSLMFAPSIEVGVVVVGAILLWSRSAFAAGVMGWIVGAAVAVGVQDLGVTYYWLPASHNYFVAGMAIGALFILPGHASLLLAGLAGAGASIFDAALQTLFPAFAYLPMASALTIWSGLGTLALAGSGRRFLRNRWPQSPPEEAWWRDVTWAQRLGRSEPLLTVPVAGVVRIAQGFEGSLSHCKQFCHALDLVRPPAPHEATNVAAATSIWKAAVTAPAAGFVERVRDGVPDNALGGCNYSESWGNYVCIRLDQGGWALLAHFKQWSIAVRPGTRVEIGNYLGAVGNSGRSPAPHLHLQVQDGPDPGASTIPFRIANYQSGPTIVEALRVQRQRFGCRPRARRLAHRRTTRCVTPPEIARTRGAFGSLCRAGGDVLVGHGSRHAVRPRPGNRPPYGAVSYAAIHLRAVHLHGSRAASRRRADHRNRVGAPGSLAAVEGRLPVRLGARPDEHRSDVRSWQRSLFPRCLYAGIAGLGVPLD